MLHFGAGFSFGAGIGVDLGSVGDAWFEKAQGNLKLTTFSGVHASDEPLVAFATGAGDILPDCSVDDLGFVPGGVDFFEDIEFRFSFELTGLVIPEEKLQGAEVDDGGRELVGAGC